MRVKQYNNPNLRAIFNKISQLNPHQVELFMADFFSRQFHKTSQGKFSLEAPIKVKHRSNRLLIQLWGQILQLFNKFSQQIKPFQFQIAD